MRNGQKDQQKQKWTKHDKKFDSKWNEMKHFEQNAILEIICMKYEWINCISVGKARKEKNKNKNKKKTGMKYKYE